MKDLILVANFLLLFNFKAAGSLSFTKQTNKEGNLERKRWPKT